MSQEVSRIVDDRFDGTAKRYGWPALLVALVCLSFLPVLHNNFVSWDDEAYLLDNAAYRGLSLVHLRWMCTTFYMSHYQPLTWLAHAVVYRVGGLDPRGFHAANVVGHAANALVLYRLIVRLLRPAAADGGRRSPDRALAAAAVGALFFALHPLRVEAVAWATAGSTVCTLFLLLTLLAYVRMQECVRAAQWWTWYALSLGCFALSLLARASGMMLPFVLLVLDYYPLSRFDASDRSRPMRILAEKLPYAALALGAAVLVLAAKQQEAMIPLADHGLVARLAQASYGLCFYIWKTVLPIGLSPLYPLPHPLEVTQPRFILCMATALTISVVLVATRQRYPWGFSAWLCYVVILFPVLGLVQAGPQIAADRYTYLGCLPWAVLVAAGVYHLQQASGVPPFARRAAWVTVAAALGCLGLLTARQTQVWRDSFTLWDHVLAIEPTSYFAYINRGSARKAHGDLDGALADYTAALRLNAEDGAAYNNRGTVRLAKGDTAGAVADFDAALRLDPSHASAYTNRGNARQSRGDLTGAIADFTQALRLAPEDSRARFNRGNARKASGDLPGALTDFTEALRLDPNDAGAFNNRGRVKQALGDLQGAVADYTEALQRTPASAPLRATVERNLAAAHQAVAANAGQR